MDISLAALLHDIGKLYQRTGIWIKIEDYKKYLVFQGKYLYYHSAFTASFIDQFIKDDNIKELSAGHHLPKPSIIKTADIIAAAHDRRDSDGDDNKDNQFILMRTSSIFNLLGDAKKNEFLPLIPLSDFSGFVLRKKLSLKQAKKEYLDLYNLFTKSLMDIRYDNKKVLYHQLYPLLKNYLYAIPANTYNTKNTYVSLFDHLKLTSAIANCMVVNEKDFIILKYHVHGITDFVYSDNDIELIHYRSIYMQVLCDLITFHILNEFNLNYENIMYSLGGQGRILLPNGKAVKQRIENLYHRIISTVNNIHNGIIKFVLSYDIYNRNDLQKGKFKNNLSKNEKFLISNEKIVIKDNLKIDYYSIGKKIINNKSIIEYNFGKKNHNINVFDFFDLGGIIINSDEVKENCYYQSYNGPLIGETKFYNLSINYQMNKKSCLVFMDIKSLGDIFNKQMSTSSQSFSTFLTLSRSLELFISKQLALICSGYKMDCLYASGDDIVFITDMIDAQIIVSKIIDGFNKYTGNNTVFNWNVKIEKITKNNISEIYKNLKEKIKEVSNNERIAK